MNLELLVDMLDVGIDGRVAGSGKMRFFFYQKSADNFGQMKTGISPFNTTQHPSIRF